jgi:hypothetical protein
MRSILVFLSTLLFVPGVSAQSLCQDSCESRNRSAVLGVSSPEKTSILNDSSCSLRLVFTSPVRGDQMSIPSGIVERNAMGLTFTAPFNKVSDLLVLNVALQSDSMFPASFSRGAKESLAVLKSMEDDPAVGLRWSLVYRTSSQSPADDRVSLRATWRNKGSSSGFSLTEVRLAPVNFALWCR